MARTALELIGQSRLGYSFDPLTENGVPHPFSDAAKLLTYVYFLGIRVLHQKVLLAFLMNVLIPIIDGVRIIFTL